MDALALNSQSQQALLALALKYEITTGNRLKWRRDADAVMQMVLDSLASGAEDLFQVAVSFLETLPVQSRKEFLQLQQMDVPEGYEARVQLYRGVAHRLLKPLTSDIAGGLGQVALSARTYRGIAWEEVVDSTETTTKEQPHKTRRVYRGQEY
jgi:hypothetical protein